MRQTLKLGITFLIVAALAMSGLAFAQTSDEVPEEVAEAAVTRIAEKLAPLVEDGTLTQDQADAVAETLAEDLPGRRGHHRRHMIGAEVAEFLGIDAEDLRTELMNGATLAEIAEANGSSADELIAFLVGNAEERLDEAVASGRLTQDEADEKLGEITERVTAMVNGEIERPAGGPGGPGGPDAEETAA